MLWIQHQIADMLFLLLRVQFACVRLKADHVLMSKEACMTAAGRRSAAAMQGYVISHRHRAEKGNGSRQESGRQLQTHNTTRN